MADNTNKTDETYNIKYLVLITLILYAIGIALAVFKPSILFISSIHSVVAGILCIILAVMFTVCIVYKFLNDVTDLY